MGTIITSVATSQHADRSGSVAHAAIAASRCLSESGVSMSEVGMLINAGIYRDDNMVEPAIAALIQREIGLGLDFTQDSTEARVVSFDVMNGACGMLNATQVAAACLQTGSARYALIVTSDGHPSGSPVSGFPYATLGGALLLSHDDADARGFGPISVACGQPDSGDKAVPYGVAGFVRMSATARADITVERSASFVRDLRELAAETVRAYASREGVDLDQCLLITSQPAPDFAVQLAASLQVPPQQAVQLTGIDGEPHTAALAAGYHQAKDRGLLAPGTQVMFVAAGAGLSCACAVYRC